MPTTMRMLLVKECRVPAVATQRCECITASWPLVKCAVHYRAAQPGGTWKPYLQLIGLRHAIQGRD